MLIYIYIAKDHLQYLVTPTSYITDAIALKLLCVWLITLIISLKKQVKSNQKYPRCKKGVAKN